MINFDAVDFSERRSEEVISFFWRSVYFESIIKCFKEVNRKKWPDLPYSFPPMHCVRINHEPDGLFNGDIQS